MDNALSLSMLSPPPPPESPDEGDHTSLGDLPAPSEVSDVQDLEQALHDGHYPAEETAQVQGVAGSIESQEEPFLLTNQRLCPVSPPSRLVYRLISQSHSLLRCSQSHNCLQSPLMFTSTPTFPPRPLPRFFARPAINTSNRNRTQ